MSERSARDVVSRLRRISVLSNSSKLDNTTIQKLNELDSFNECSMFIKSQLRRALCLYLEHESESPSSNP